MKIKFIDLSHVHNEEHHQFLSNYYDLLGTHTSVVSIIGPLMPEFAELLAKEKQLVDVVVKSGYTERIALADKRRDRAIRGLHATVKSFLNHFDPATVDAAKLIEIRIQAFRKEINKKTYEAEETAITIFVD
ncbi:MAG: DUF6261 family protein, partial [Dysgonamonadaceae bacterium]|nr:DUF6261 family protein [Dysgonamonadaceae bacterium]